MVIGWEGSCDHAITISSKWDSYGYSPNVWDSNTMGNLGEWLDRTCHMYVCHVICIDKNNAKIVGMCIILAIG